MQSQMLDISTLSHQLPAIGVRRDMWRWVRLSLIVGDLIAVIAGFAFAYALRFLTGWDIFQSAEVRPLFYITFTALLAPCWIAISAMYSLYTPQHLFHGSQEYARVFNASLFGVVLITAISFFLPHIVIARAWLILAWLSVVVITLSWRFAFRRHIYHRRRRGALLERTVILGANAEGRAVAQQLQERPESGAKIIGFIDDTLAPGEVILPDMPVLGSVNAFQSVVEQNNINAVIIADTAVVRERLPQIYGAMETLQQLDVRLDPGLFELLTTGVQVYEQAGVPLLALNKTRITGLHALGKMLIDRLGALIALILLSPLFIGVAIAVYLDSGGPVIYRRRVVGVGKQPFDAFKFRTMIPERRKSREPYTGPERRLSDKGRDDPRVTRIGHFLRRTSIDELPQLLNVLLGQMSLVGPRMLTAEELRHFGRWQHNLLTVRPGLTGLWQISGRSDLGYEDRVRLDMHYIRNYSLWLDLSIIMRTIPSILSGKGAY